MRATIRVALVAAIAVLIFGTPASAYPNVQLINMTRFEAHVHISYLACRGDQVTVRPGADARPSARRGMCLLRSITATLTGGPAVRSFTSSGTPLYRFAIRATGGHVAIEHL